MKLNFLEYETFRAPVDCNIVHRTLESLSSTHSVVSPQGPSGVISPPPHHPQGAFSNSLPPPKQLMNKRRFLIMSGLRAPLEGATRLSGTMCFAVVEISLPVKLL